MAVEIPGPRSSQVQGQKDLPAVARPDLLKARCPKPPKGLFSSSKGFAEDELPRFGLTNVERKADAGAETEAVA